MTKIAIVKWSIDRTDGGLKVAVNLSNELSKYYEIHLLSMISTEQNFFSLKNEICYRNLSSKKLSMSKNFFQAVQKLRTYLIENKIDIVLGIGISMNGVGIASTLGLKTKFVSCDHTNSIVDIDTKVKKIQRFIAAKFASKIITLTNQDRLNYIKKYKMNVDKVDYIYNWMDSLESVEKYNINSKKIITVGRFDYQKGFDYLSQVANLILSKYPDWEWDIYGDGVEEIKQGLRTELEAGGVLSRVHFKGNVKGTENIYPGHAIYVMTSRYEGLPLVLLEAKQYGLPIVSFKCPTGPSEIVLNNENGYLIDTYDVDYMSEKIIDLIEDVNLRVQFSDKSMKDTDKFSKNKIIKQWEDLIEEMTEE